MMLSQTCLSQMLLEVWIIVFISSKSFESDCSSTVVHKTLNNSVLKNSFHMKTVFEDNWVYY